MIFHFTKSFFLFFFILFITIKIQAQVEDIGIMFDLSQAFVENIYDEDETIAITFINDENELVTEILEAEIDLLETKGIKIGMEVSLEGERFEENDKIILHSIKSLTPYNSRKKFEFRGRIEKIQDGYVYVDGNKVLMAGKGKIKGSGGWEKNNFNSVNDLKLGAWATVKGTRNNGIVNAKNLTTYPNRVKIREEKEFSDLVDFYDDFYPIWADKEARKALYGEEFGSGKIYDNDDIQRFVEAVGFKLIPEYAKKEFKFSFVVIDDLSFNASMTPVGLCIVHLGLISSSSNEAQIAAVLGHEIAHAVYHHSLHEAREKQKMKEKKDRRERRRQTFSKIKVGDVTTVLAPELDQKISKSKEKVDKVLDVALEKPKRRKQKDTDILDLVVASANFNDEKLFFSYNREQETQSDRIGLHYLVQAGYDPREAPKVWKKLYQSSEHDSEKTTENESKLVAFLDVLSKKESGNTLFEKGKIKESRTAFRSHPDDLKRYEELNKLIAFYWSNADIIENATKGLIFNW